jgi:hypothetical protein
VSGEHKTSKGMDMGKKRHKVIDPQRARAAAGGWYDFTPTASGFFPCGESGMTSATVSKPGGTVYGAGWTEEDGGPLDRVEVRVTTSRCNPEVR